MFLINIKTNQKVAIFLWIDNVFAVAHHENILDQLTSNLRKASKHPPKGCNIEWKYVSVSNTATFLGIDFSLKNGNLCWMHTSSNMSRWSTIQLKTRDSVRNIMKIIGVLMWDTMVAQSS